MMLTPTRKTLTAVREGWLRRLWTQAKDAAVPSDSAAYLLRFILLAVAAKAALWAVLGQDIPDEFRYFAEIVDLATRGTAHSYTGHTVGTFAYVSAAFYRLGEAVGVSPLVSVRLFGGALTVGATAFGHAMMLRITESRFVALSTAILVGFSPMYSFIGSSSNSDTLVAFLVVAGLYLCACILADGVSLARLGALLVIFLLGLWTKDRILLLVPPAVFAVGLSAVWSLPWGEHVREGWRKRLRTPERRFDLLVSVAILLALGRLLLPPLMDMEAARTPIGSLPSLKNAWEVWTSPQFATSFAKQFWAYFGLLHVPAPPWFYALHTILLALSVGGLALGLCTVTCHWLPQKGSTIYRTRVSGTRASSVVMLLLAILFGLYAVALYGIRLPGGSQGRYLFPLITAVYGLASLGLSFLVPRRVEKAAILGLLTLSVSANLYALIHIFGTYFY